ncbi:MAG: trypsin-like peptidase domain-containing protein [Pseudomonadota bacterium]
MAGTFKRSAVFLAGSILAGLVLASLAAMLWPELIRPQAAAVPVAEVPKLQPTPVAAVTIVPEKLPSADTAPLERATVGSLADAVRASAPAVVNVYAQRTVTERVPTLGLEQLLGGPGQPRFRERVQTSLGSGVIVDREGHIVTNQHVIANYDQISAQLADGRVASVKVVGSDPDTDLAVLKIDLPRLPVMTLGRSDLMQVGDVVLAIGSPLGLSQTVTHGIVSATGRAQLGVATFENFIQTDAAINIGNSGGALVNTRGELIGINTAVLGKNLGAEGIGVAIPVDLVRGVMREILQHGRVIRGWVGIVPEDISPEHVRQLNLPHAGVVISNLYRDSPALQAGLTRGDMIESVDGRPVRNAQDTLAQIARRKPGTAVTLVGMRGTQRFSLQMKVVEPPRLPAK